MMTKSEILKEVDRLGPWWRHNIDLGNGISTKLTGTNKDPIDRPREKWRGIKDYFPEDLKGKSVIDVGCSEGFFSIEAKKRGADYVLGIDLDPRVIERAKFAGKILNLDIEYRQGSVYDIDPGWGQFDVVIFFGVLYHLDFPFYALHKISEICKKDLYFDSHTLVDDPSNGYMDMMRFFKDGFAGDKTNRWVPNKCCLENMLKSTGFKNIMDISYTKYRTLLIAKK